MKTALLLLTLAAALAMPSCTLTAEQKARLDAAAQTGDKLLKIGVKYGVITREEAEAAHDVGHVVVSSTTTAPDAPQTIEVTAQK